MKQFRGCETQYHRSQCLVTGHSLIMLGFELMSSELDIETGIVVWKNALHLHQTEVRRPINSRGPRGCLQNSCRAERRNIHHAPNRLLAVSTLPWTGSALMMYSTRSTLG